MGNVTNGYIRYALCDKKDSDNFFSVRGDGWCMVCELELLDTYESEEAALQAIASLVRNDIIRERLMVTKVIYEFHNYSDGYYDTATDETIYEEKHTIKTNFARIKEKIQHMNVDGLIEYLGGDCCENILCVELDEQNGECYKKGPKYNPDHNCERCIKNYLLSKEQEA